MVGYKWIKVIGTMVEAPVKPCPCCKKTPDLMMPLDLPGKLVGGKWIELSETWVWKIRCSCKVNSEASISIRNTSKTDLTRFLDKLDEWYDKWNSGNDCRAYEKKVIDLKMVKTLGIR